MSPRRSSPTAAANIAAAPPAASADPSASGPLSLKAYMVDEKTRVFNYNGRKLVAILGCEKFPGERTFKLPTKVIEFASRQPLTSALLPCRIGYFPNARGQKVSRPDGDWAFTLLFCLDGFGTLNLSSGSHRVGRGMVVLLPPFEFHAYEADPAQPWSYYWIHFNGTMALQYYQVVTGGGKHTCIAFAPEIGFVQAFDHILYIYHEGVAYKMLVQACTTMHQILGNLYAQVGACRIAQEDAEARVERTIEVMRNNIEMHVSIYELAAIANMSHAYYTLQFRRHTGESPRCYFNKLKMAKACEYLETTNAKIASIAHLVGYDDEFYFCRLFKQIIGQTPTEYRCDPKQPADTTAKGTTHGQTKLQ